MFPLHDRADAHTDSTRDLCLGEFRARSGLTDAV
jgi:hypothetical protein